MRNSKQIWSVILFIAFLAAIGCTIYFWATMFVWIPLFVVSMYFFYCDIRREEYLPYYYSWHQQAIVYGTGAISMIWQYWFTPIIWGFKLWECLLGLSVVTILFVFVFNTTIRENRATRRQIRREEYKRRMREKELEVTDVVS